MTTNKLHPTTPGEMLLEEFLIPLKISQYRLAKEIHVSQIRISQIIKGTRAITVDTAMRLAYYFGNSTEFWINLQSGYEIKMAQLHFEKKIKKTIKPFNYKSAA